MTLGIGENDNIPFEQFEMEIKKNDLIIAFTDGYSDQFGGDSGKKFKHKQLEELLIKNSHLQLQELKQLLESTIQNWRGNIEQVDDICVVGIRV